MKLSAYIALLEAIRDSDGDLDVFVTLHNGLSSYGLTGKQEPAKPSVVALVAESTNADVLIVADDRKFRAARRPEYKDAGIGVRLG